MIVVCVGTRPDFIKMAPVVRRLEEAGAPFKILHTGQHYSPELAGIYGELNLRPPDHQILGVERFDTHAKKTGYIMEKAEEYLKSERPDVVLVQGDTDHSLACAIAARKLRLGIGHVESGLRSGDWRMPEEHNRRMIDHISDCLFAPTVQSLANLFGEHVSGIVILTGNTVIDALETFKSQIMREKPILDRDYALMTAHREENVDDPQILKDLIRGAELIHSALKLPVLFPVHPRTRSRIEGARISSKSGVKLIPPLPYFRFLSALMQSSIVLTDSGGVQEEACALQVPCVVLRDYTDRPESVSVGAAFVAGTKPKKILKAAQRMMGSPRSWPNPFDPYGDRNASGRIVEFLIK